MNADTNDITNVNRDFTQTESQAEDTWQNADDKEVLSVSGKLMERNTVVYEELAK